MGAFITGSFLLVLVVLGILNDGPIDAEAISLFLYFYCGIVFPLSIVIVAIFDNKRRLGWVVQDYITGAVISAIFMLVIFTLLT